MLLGTMLVHDREHAIGMDGKYAALAVLLKDTSITRIGTEPSGTYGSWQQRDLQ